MPGSLSIPRQKARAIINRLGRQVSEDIAAFKFNTALAKMMEALNNLEDLKQPVHPNELRDMVKIVAPYAPFLTDELWTETGAGRQCRTTPIGRSMTPPWNRMRASRWLSRSTASCAA